MKQKNSNISINSNETSIKHEQILKQLKNKIFFTEQDLQNLINSQSKNKFVLKVVEFNNLAIQLIENEEIDQALIYLIEAEKILQKASEKGKQFNKKIVISVLHNLACCYQKNWELQTCSSYIQALIFNLNSYLKDLQTAPSSTILQLSQIKNQSSKKLSQKAIQLMINIQNKQRLGRYYLQFCAVNSQIKNHSGALIAARKSIQIMKKMFKQLTLFLKHYNNKISQQNKQNYQSKLRLVHQISKITDNINVSQYQMILQTTKYYLKRWSNNQSKEFFLSQKSIQLESKFKNFSIGTIAKMNTLSHNSLFIASQSRKNQLIVTQSIIQKVLIIIIGYFIISTQLRLIAQLKNPIISQVSDTNNSNGITNYLNDSEFKEAQIYHLFSIMLSAIFIPFQILYMKHILFAYKNHYNVELFDGKIEYGQQKMYEDFLFTISQIKKPSLLGFDFQDSLRISQIGNQVFVQQNGTQIRYTKNSTSDPLKKFSLLVHSQKDDNRKKSKSNKKKMNKQKSKTKSKSKSKNKKSTVKTISALSTYSKNKQKIQPSYSKSPNMHTQQSLSKSKNKRSTVKSPRPITSLQTLTEQIHKKKPKKEEGAKKKNQYDGIKTQQVKKKKNIHLNGIQQTNAYFLNKKSEVKSRKPNGSSSKDSKKIKDRLTKESSPFIKDSNYNSKKDLAKIMTINNPTELYFHKNEKVLKSSNRQKQSKSKSKQKSKKNSHIFNGNKSNTDLINSHSPNHLNYKKGILQHYG